jgi:hypothetical protein
MVQEERKRLTCFFLEGRCQWIKQSKTVAEVLYR